MAYIALDDENLRNFRGGELVQGVRAEPPK